VLQDERRARRRIGAVGYALRIFFVMLFGVAGLLPFLHETDPSQWAVSLLLFVIAAGLLYQLVLRVRA